MTALLLYLFPSILLYRYAQRQAREEGDPSSWKLIPFALSWPLWIFIPPITLALWAYFTVTRKE